MSIGMTIYFPLALLAHVDILQVNVLCGIGEVHAVLSALLGLNAIVDVCDDVRGILLTGLHIPINNLHGLSVLPRANQRLTALLLCF